MNIFKKTIFGLIKKLKFLPAKMYMPIYHEYYTGEKLDFDNPITFNQKIQWIKVFYQPTILSQLVDKYAVREHIREKIGEQYLNKLIGVYSSADEIPFAELPKRFVLKGTHGSNYNYIVKEKKTETVRIAKKKITKWLKRNYYYRSGLEWAYKNIPPRVIIEEFMEEEGQETLRDFKFFCFNGKPEFIQVDLDRFADNSRCFYDVNWKKLPFNKGKVALYKGEVDQPENLEEMTQLATILSEDFPFVRVDFFSVNGKTIFGEMTFYPGDGRTQFYPEKYNTIFGDMLKLPPIPPNEKRISSI